MPRTCLQPGPVFASAKGTANRAQGVSCGRAKLIRKLPCQVDSLKLDSPADDVTWRTAEWNCEP